MKSILFLTIIILTAGCASHCPDAGRESANVRRAQAIGEELRALVRQWADAVKAHDVEAVDRIQADQYIFTSPGGKVWTKTEALESVRAGDLQIESYEMSEMEVALHGDMGIVTYRVDWKGTFRDADISGPQRVSDVFVKQDGRWRCVASAATRISQP
jgi:ketosteroid isomerase-like protein